MDFKEDFEFKPLSEGLGFHSRKNKKDLQPEQNFMAGFEAVETKTTPGKTSEKNSEKSAGGVYFLDLDTDTMTDQLFEPQAKKSFGTTPAPAMVQNTQSQQNTVISPTQGTRKNQPDPKKTVDEILHSLKNRNQALESQLEISARSNAPGTPVQKQARKPFDNKILGPAATQPVNRTTMGTLTQPYGFQTMTPALTKTEMSFTAAFLDGLLIVASCLLCLIVLLSITQMDLISLLTQSGQTEIYFSTFLLFAVVAMTYLTTTRVFLGSTPGEWAFDQQAGTDDEQRETQYVLKVVYRSALAIGTCFIIMPIISFAMAKDVLGEITGLHLFERK
ncbi:MAG: hypothetical protein ACK5P5_08415 [Pseudobdellovibrionaceae bacterium]